MEQVIELTNADLNNRDFVTALQKMDTHVGWTGAQMHVFNKLKYRQEKETTAVRKSIDKLVDKHAKKRELEKDEKPDTRPGAMALRDEHGMPVWEDHAAFTKDHDELMAIKFTLKGAKLKTDQIDGVGLNSCELRACSMIIEDYPNLEDNDEKALAQ